MRMPVQYFCGMFAQDYIDRMNAAHKWLKSQGWYSPKLRRETAPQDVVTDFNKVCFSIHAESEIRMSGGFFD